MVMVMATATENAYIKMSNHPKAVDILEVLAKERPKDPDVWFLLVESQSKADNLLRVHQGRAGFFVLNGLTGKAGQQLNYALTMDADASLTNAPISERVKQVKQIDSAMQRLW